MDQYYLLKGKKTVKCDNVIEWAQEFEKSDRQLWRDGVDEMFVSTVFLGVNHNFSEDGPPILFETMVFDKAVSEGELGGRKFKYRESHEDYTQRYSTYEEAEEGHFATVETLQKDVKKSQSVVDQKLTKL